MFHKQPSPWVFCVFSPFLSLVTWFPSRCYSPFIHKTHETKNQILGISYFFNIFMQYVFVFNNTFLFANLSSLNYEQGQWYFYSWLLRNPTYLTWFHQFCTCQPNKVNDSIFYYWKVKSNFVACQGIIHIYPTSSYMQLFLLNKFCPFFNKKIGKFFFFLV
jgi:hypothetical protein